MTFQHQPVLVDAVVEMMALSQGRRVADCCAGLGGHACEFLSRIGPDGFLLGTDLDAGAIEVAEGRLRAYGVRYELVHANYTQIPRLLAERRIPNVHAVFMDLGVCSCHFDQPRRGFSVWHPGPLDMRMDSRQALSAAEIVNQWPRERITQLLWDYADERQAGRIASAIVERRRSAPIATTRQLAALVEQVKGKSRRGIHAATKCFMAIRMAVNRELENLSEFLSAAPGILAPDGALVVLTYHSKEDKLVKTAFRDGHKSGVYSAVTRKPIVPSPEEMAANPRSRSAKLRRAVRAL